MLYLRGEVFIRAALVKVSIWKVKFNYCHCDYQGERNSGGLSDARGGDHWSARPTRGTHEGGSLSHFLLFNEKAQMNSKTLITKKEIASLVCFHVNSCCGSGCEEFLQWLWLWRLNTGGIPHWCCVGLQEATLAVRSSEHLKSPSSRWAEHKSIEDCRTSSKEFPKS